MVPESSFAAALPELAYPARGEDAPAPELLLLNEPLAVELGLDPDWLRSDEGIDFLLGHDGGWALAYAGHQFGQYSPLLGDGRAILLGEFSGREVQAKGTGRTQFSRRGDGRGPLDAMLREYLISEYLHSVGVASTRGLAVLSTGRKIQRQLVTPAGVCVRVAKSHVRVGSFELVRRNGSPELLERLSSYAWERFPGGLSAVVSRQAQTVAQWMGIGFVHGVMNTDNCSISGETLDFGPCAFLDAHDPGACFSSIDVGKRYAYGRQPAMMQWNLMRLAECLEEEIDFEPAFRAALLEVWAEKLGTSDPSEINKWFERLALEQPDHTLAHATMPGKNPQVIPRNEVVQRALDAALAGDLAPYLALQEVLSDPFTKPEQDYQAAASGYVTYCGT
ncbi:protein adenylyltransferase SelO family protein [Corynebacterium sp. H128]|uniref:protein adenylyltransferase SelO family protein n=1 Tax=unclassified Corynebacterium TaxID=2624378 RepID=UPI0030A5D185